MNDIAAYLEVNLLLSELPNEIRQSLSGRMYSDGDCLIIDLQAAECCSSTYPSVLRTAIRINSAFTQAIYRREAQGRKNIELPLKPIMPMRPVFNHFSPPLGDSERVSGTNPQ